MWFLFTLVVSMTILVQATEGKHAWERPGCHKVGKCSKHLFYLVTVCATRYSSLRHRTARTYHNVVFRK